MKKINWKDIKFHQVDIDEIDDRTLLLNLYITQLATLAIGLIVIFFQKQRLLELLRFTGLQEPLLWGGSYALLVLLADMLVSRWVPEDITDDGGVNERLFGARPLWHIVIMSAIVAFCEELLFRGAIQHAWGAYWTSILFAGIHFRYLRHWLMTGLVFSISYGLGWIYVQTGSFWTPVFAHFAIDLVMGLILRFRREDG